MEAWGPYSRGSQAVTRASPAVCLPAHSTEDVPCTGWSRSSRTWQHTRCRGQRKEWHSQGPCIRAAASPSSVAARPGDDGQPVETPIKDKVGAKWAIQVCCHFHETSRCNKLWRIMGKNFEGVEGAERFKAATAESGNAADLLIAYEQTIAHPPRHHRSRRDYRYTPAHTRARTHHTGEASVNWFMAPRQPKPGSTFLLFVAAGCSMSGTTGRWNKQQALSPEDGLPGV